MHSKKRHIPYIISITGSVAVGKSTTARILQMLLSRWSEHNNVELITTDDFLYSNQVLKERGLMKKKGFPTSFDIRRLKKFIIDVKSGVSSINIPIYSHLIYDIISNSSKIIVKLDILILEVLNTFQKINYPFDMHHMFSSNFVNFSIYIDAPEKLIKSWCINRFLKLSKVSTANPTSYFYKYAYLATDKIVNLATSTWSKVNYINLKKIFY